LVNKQTKNIVYLVLGIFFKYVDWNNITPIGCGHLKRVNWQQLTELNLSTSIKYQRLQQNWSSRM